MNCNTCMHNFTFSNSLIIHDRLKRKSIHQGCLEIGGRNYINKANFVLDFLTNSGSFEKYVKTLVRRTSSNFKTPRSSLKMLGFTSHFQLTLFGKIGGSPPTRV